MSTAVPQQQKTSKASSSNKKVIPTTQVEDDNQHQGDENTTFISGTGAGQQQDCVAGDNNQDASMIMPFSQEQHHQQQDDDQQQQQQQQENMIMMMNMQQQQQQNQQQVQQSATSGATSGFTSLASQQQQQENISIDRLTEQGIAQVDINKLKSAGIFTVPGIHMQCRKELNNIKGLSEAKVDKVVEAAKKLADAGFTTATKCLERRNNIPKLTTGSNDLNALLGGGIEACAITEAFGEFRTGKSQLAHTLCVTCQLPTSQGGNQGKAVFVDTEGTFRPERIKPIAERFGLDPAEVLDNILVARAFTHEHQANLISAVASKMAQDKYALLVVDSITALFRTDFSGRGELAERQQKLGKMMNQLMKVAEEFSVAVYITNQVVADPGASAMFVADPKKPVGGHIIAHASTTRLSLRKGRGENRICKIYDSPSLPETECQFSISEQGINDATSA